MPLRYGPVEYLGMRTNTGSYCSGMFAWQGIIRNKSGVSNHDSLGSGVNTAWQVKGSRLVLGKITSD